MDQNNTTHKSTLLDRRSAIRSAGLAFAASLVATRAFGSRTAQPRTGSNPPVAPPQTEFVFESLVTISPAVEIGPSSHGTRRYIPITGGTFAGPKIKGVVLPGGADWQLERPDGATEVDATYSIKADDGAVIIVHNRGIIAGPYFKTVPQFEAPIGPHDWLNKAVFVGSVAGARRPGAVVVRVFRVL